MPDIAFNSIDFIVLAVLVLSGILATFRGVTREIIGLIGWGVAFLVARFFAMPFDAQFGSFIGDEATSMTLGFIIPFVLAALGWYIIANLIAPGLKAMSFGRADKPLGFVFGVIRGFVLIVLVYIGALFAVEGESEFPASVLESTSINPVRAVSRVAVDFAGLGNSIPIPAAVIDAPPVPPPSEILLPDEQLPTDTGQ